MGIRLVISKMKVTAILLALISVAFAAPRDDDCMICTEKVDILWNVITGEGKGEVEHMIIKQVCSKETDPSECTMLVKQYWGKVAMALFTHANAKGICVALEFCSNKRSGDDWNCDTCKSGVMELGGLLTSDEASDDAVTFFARKSILPRSRIGIKW